MTPEPPPFAELHCRSTFTFLVGASQPEELVERAAAKLYSALALTDECSVSGVVRAHLHARESGLHFICGSEIQLTTEGGHAHARVVILAQNKLGWGNLCECITLARRRASKGSYSALVTDVEGRNIQAPHLGGMPGCLVLLLPEEDATAESLFAQAMWMKTWFPGRSWIVAPRPLGLDDELRMWLVEQAAERTGIAIVASASPVMHTRHRKAVQDVLTAVRVGTTVAGAGYALQPNAEAYLRGRGVLARQVPAAWMEETVKVASLCTFSLEELRYEYPREVVPEGETAASHLRKLTYEGARGRYPAGVPEKVRAQIEHELVTIAQLEYEPYFLTCADIVHWARSRNILCQGRGSAANSAVCYCLGVTSVDPERMSVLFERFISVERREPPDIDIDFEHQRREEVMQYIYDKYGRDRAALTAVAISYRTKSSLRDVGKALGIPLDQVEALAGGAYGEADDWISESCLLEHGIDADDPTVVRWLEIADTVRGFPRNLSQHPGGFVIAREKISRLVPVENAAMDGRSIIQWDKDDLDATGLIKVDILALGMLTAIHRALDLVGEKVGGAPMRMQDVPAEDVATYDMICKADTVGVFQIESRAQMSMLPRIKPRCFYDLVIQVAIVRPGPIQGGMVHPYLRRRAGEETFGYPNDAVRQVTERTLGICLYQEQAMKLAMVCADYTPGEADQLRRAMGAWRKRGGLEVHEQRLTERMEKNGYQPDFISQVLVSIKGFGSYGFPESHSASFALLVYVSCWLKRHHPDAMLSGLLNSQPMGFYGPAQLVRDAREHGVLVRPVDVSVSVWETTLEEPARNETASSRWDTTYTVPLRAVRLGMSRIAGMREEAARRIVSAREQGPFASVEDLAMRAQLDAHDLTCLAGADALLSVAGHRPDAVWAAKGVDTRPTRMLREARTVEETFEFEVPQEGAEIADDYATTGLTLRRHPLALIRPKLERWGIRTAEDLRVHAGDREQVRASGIVTHRQRPSTANGVVFATLEDETGTVNIIVWPQVAEEHRAALLGARLLSVEGTWQSEKGVQSLVAAKLVDHGSLLGALRARSRDFR